MDTFLISITLITILSFLIYFISKSNIDHLYIVLKSIFKKDSIVFSIISLLYFPGTLIHELSHALMARLLFLHVVSIRLIPQWKQKSIILGTVTYAKRGRLSSVIVGIAPIFGGLAILSFMGTFHMFPGTDMRMMILFGYLIIAISSTMFSSKQDLVDAVYAIPAVLLLLAILYGLFKYGTLEKFTNIFVMINKYLNPVTDMLIFALFYQAFLFLVLFLMKKLLRR